MTRPAAPRDLAHSSPASSPGPASSPEPAPSPASSSSTESPSPGPVDRPARVVLTRRRRLRALGAAMALGAASVLAPCSTTSPAQTTVPYQPADGVAAQSGSVLARDLVLLTDAKGSPVRLSGAVINEGTEQQVVTFALASATASPTATSTGSAGSDGTGITVPAGKHQQLTTVQFSSSPVEPGAMTGLNMTTSAGSTLVQVPVLLPNGYYSTLSPTKVATATAPATTAAAG